MPDLDVDPRRALVSAGVPLERVTLADPSDPLDRVAPGTWVLLPGEDASWVVGGSERGRLAIYDQYETLGLAAGALAHLTSTAVPRRPLDREEAATLAGGAVDFMREVLRGSNDGSPHGVLLSPGTAFDRFGSDDGNSLFAFRTPVPMRSLSPTEATSSYRVYVVRRPLGGGVRAGRVTPWFEQPGGGVKIQLPRCVRWYCDTGFLDEVEPPIPE